MMSEMDSFLLLTSLITFLIVSTRNVSPFVREVAGVNSLCCVEVFVALSSIDGFIQ